MTKHASTIAAIAFSVVILALSAMTTDSARKILENNQRILENNQTILENNKIILENNQKILENAAQILDNAARIAELQQQWQDNKPPEEIDEEVQSGQVMGADGPRSSKWPKAMHTYRDGNPLCQWLNCPTPDDRVNVHHIIPVHWAKLIGHPWLELCQLNLITLCHQHHLACGHGGNFKHLNIDVRADAKAGKFNSRGLSVWPGDDVMKKWLIKIMGPPRETQPDELPPGMFDPSMVPMGGKPMAWHCNDCERLMVTMRVEAAKTTLAP